MYIINKKAAFVIFHRKFRINQKKNEDNHNDVDEWLHEEKRLFND